MSCLRRLFHFFLTPEKRALARFISLFLAGASWFTVIALWLCALSPYVDPRQFGAAARKSEMKRAKARFSGVRKK